MGKQIIATVMMTAAVASAALDVRIDLGNYASGGNWNSVGANASLNNLVDWNTGLQTALGITSAGWFGSASTDGWPVGEDVDWVAAGAADDYFYMYGDFMDYKTGTVTVQGLTDGTAYRLQLVSSENYWGVGPADIKAGGNWADADYQGKYSSNIGDNWDGETAYKDRNWLIWDSVYSSGGSITVSVTLNPGMDVSTVNALRIEAIPEPATAMILGLGGALIAFYRRFFGQV